MKKSAVPANVDRYGTFFLIPYDFCDCVRNLFQRELLLHRAFFPCGTGHAVDRAGLFVLPDGGRSCLPHFQQSVGAVSSHACQDNTHGMITDIRRDRFEENIDGGTAAMHSGSRLAGDPHGTGRLAQNAHVELSRSDVDGIWLRAVPVCGFLDMQYAVRIQPGCKQQGKGRRDMLCDDDGGHRGTQLGEDDRQSLCTARGGADRNELDTAVRMGLGHGRSRRFFDIAFVLDELCLELL